ncbi:MAG: hypothetical protein H6741_29405 [Alphaproteobacteria bacterium]|nr:hypothetical protein [Alphaproteobacteria bacterium]MCB9796838.1 hypothetical protein [Alphaproteobacteria bacterium]
MRALRPSLLALPLGALTALVACNGVKLDVDDPEVTDCEEMSFFYPDADGDGLGSGDATEACEAPAGYVDNDDDEQPDCFSNDTDDCGVCAGNNADMDCGGECFGEADLDDCGICSGGSTGREPSSGEDHDGDGQPDDCNQCSPEGMQRYIVQWQGISNYDGDGGPYVFEVVLHENGDVLIQYDNLLPLNPSATIGLRGDDEGEVIEVAHNDESILDYATLLFHATEDGGVSWNTEGAPGLNWMNVEAVGMGNPLGDDDYATYPLPFEFPFYGETYDEVHISSNGFLWFGSRRDMPDYRNESLDGVEDAMIAAFWDDLNPAVGGIVYTFADPGDCEVDCEGMEGGFADVDDCDTCFGGRTGLSENSEMDCAGECGGEAWTDDCRTCVGGSTGLEPTDPDSCPEVPDFIIDQPTLASSLYVDYVDVREGSCAIAEGCVSGAGTRKVVRFTTMVGNVGFADFHLGSPPGDNFIWSECHEHYHYEAYANYDLLNPEGEVVNTGHKNGWCLMDLSTYDTDIATSNCNTFTCSNQGVSMGCADIYSSSLDCQWIDVTDMADGDYTLRVITNPESVIEELNYTNNTAEVSFTMTGDTVTLSR